MEPDDFLIGTTVPNNPIRVARDGTNFYVEGGCSRPRSVFLLPEEFRPASDMLPMVSKDPDYATIEVFASGYVMVTFGKP